VYIVIDKRYLCSEGKVWKMTLSPHEIMNPILPPKREVYLFQFRGAATQQNRSYSRTSTITNAVVVKV
jgi:hypothetical protein